MALSLDQLIEQRLGGYPWATRIPPEAREVLLTDTDGAAAWQLYVELVTRIATQPLDDEEGVEVTALESISDLFPIARDIMRKAGPGSAACSAFALALLNYRVRPFTAAWHKPAAEGRLSDPAIAGRFRDELRDLQQDLRVAADTLAELAQTPCLCDYSPP